ncbi:MAG: tetratricopeptide repeat protein [Candidatus Obscuribacterales bacterium]|nr:tetratricopeptide repeat protein [Candidatus Obscuribacterales bacterium]
MTWQNYLTHASQLVSQGKYADAERIIYQAFNEARAQNDREKIYTSLDLLGYLAFVQQQYDKSEQIYKYGAQVKISVMGQNHIEIGKTLKNLIAAAYHMKRYEQVVVYAREALRIYGLNYGNGHAECRQLATNLIELLKWLKRIPEADEIRRLYLEVAQPPPQQPAQQQYYQQPQQQQPVQQQPVQQQHYQQVQQQQPVQQQQYYQQAQQSPAQPQPVQQQHYQQVQQQQPVQQQQGQINPAAAQHLQNYQNAQGEEADNKKKRDYANFAKSVCDVCQMPYEGSECLRCTSGQIAVFDPSSRLGNDFG